jgi:hypothetical protein
MAEHYDVIIIATGAGEERWPTRLPVRVDAFCWCSAGTFCLGKWTTGIRGRCLSRGSTSPRTPGSTVRASRSSRRCTTSWAGRPRCTVRPCIGCGRRTSASSTTWTGSRRPGRCPTMTSSPGTPRPSSCTRCAATVVRTPPRVTARRPTRGPPCRTRTGSRSWLTAWPRGAGAPSTPPAASCWTNPSGRAARASAVPGVTGIRAWCPRSPTPR